MLATAPCPLVTVAIIITRRAYDLTTVGIG